MKITKALSSIIITIAFVLVMQTKIGVIPPLGAFLNPVTGFWQNAESKKELASRTVSLKGLLGKVSIKYDEHRIPHIFAENNHDLYYAQGYVTAQDRLWQMDMQTRSAAGRLSEVIGISALETDRYHRRMGMVFAAEHTLAKMMKDPDINLAVNAYTEGVNAYIHQLSPRDLPIEFKLLDYAPEDWKPINSAFLLKLMSETLAGGSNELAMSNTLNKFGAKVTEDLFPDYPSHEDPIIPAGTPYNFSPLPIPLVPSGFKIQAISAMKSKPKIEGLGSNNWALSGSKTSTGYPILANDPHLNLTYPSIWYEIQMAAPGVNVNGVSLPGAPCVIIGYNQQVSWGVTNVDADVLDWYQIKFKDASKKEYWYNGRWNKALKRIESISIRGRQPVIDTVFYTIHGPVVYDNASMAQKGRNNVPVGNALRWIAHDESNEFKTFYLLNRAKNYDDYRKALIYYNAPAQNFVFASAQNDIAITVNGKLPIKYKGQGKFIMDGGNPDNDWHGYIPYEQLPFIKNPARGFVSSANQSPTDQKYPYYLNWQFTPYERGKRINDRLMTMQKATIDSIRLLQLDNFNIRAQDILPAMFNEMQKNGLNANQQFIFNNLRSWDKKYTLNSISASVFELWWLKFYWSIWGRNFVHNQDPFYPPSADRTETLLIKEPRSTWFDDPQTPLTETAADVLRNSFNATINEMTSTYGQPGPAWQWGNVKKFEIRHLAGLEGFGSGNFPSEGNGLTINALIDGHGPSWRMIVQLGPNVKAYGILPGGQSGNPGSYFYDDMLQTWKKGNLNELLYLYSAEEASTKIKSTLTLTK